MSGIKGLTNVIDPEEYGNSGTQWVAIIYMKYDAATYSDSFGVAHIPKVIKKFKSNKIINTSIYRIQAYDLILSRYFCIKFINFMLDNKRLGDFINLFSPIFKKWWNTGIFFNNV